jgi:hypothetical protein
LAPPSGSRHVGPRWAAFGLDRPWLTADQVLEDLELAHEGGQLLEDRTEGAQEFE